MEHHFNVQIAKEYGTNAAILLNHIEYWTEYNKANNNNFYDGYYWTYNSKKAFSEMFPYMSEEQVKYSLKKLVDAGIIITGNYNKNRCDRTLWYAITSQGISIVENSRMQDSDFPQCIVENSPMQQVIFPNATGNVPQPIPNIIPNIIPNNNISSIESKSIDSIVSDIDINDWFDHTYEIFPRKGNKVQAKTTFTKKLQGMEKEEARKKAQSVYQLLKNFIEQWRKEEKELKFTPYFSSWLNANVPDSPKSRGKRK